MGFAVTDLRVQVDRLRTELRQISTKSLRAQVDNLDHGADLAGLADDDHTQYHTDARHRNEHGSFFAERTTNIVLTQDADTTILFNSIADEDDPNNDLTYATGTGILTFNTTGWYVIVVNINLSALSGGDVDIWITKNGTSIRIAENVIHDALQGYIAVSLSLMAKFTATDTIRVRALIESPDTATINGSLRTHLSAARLA